MDEPCKVVAESYPREKSVFQGEEIFFREISPGALSARDERLIYAGRSKNMKFGKVNHRIRMDFKIV